MLSCHPTPALPSQSYSCTENASGAFPKIGQKSGSLPEGHYKQDSEINILHFPLKASAGVCVSEC